MGAKTSIAESVESLFLFYENSESEHIKVIFNVLGFCFLLFQRNVKGFASKQMEGKSLFVFSVHGTCLSSRPRERI